MHKDEYTKIIACECDLYENKEGLLIGTVWLIKTIVKRIMQ